MGKLSKAKWCLLGCLIIILVFMVGSVFVPGRLANAVKWVTSNDFACKLRALSEQEAVQEHRLIEMVVETIGVGRIDYQPVVILKEKGGESYLPILIGILEANAISVTLGGVEMPRPLTPDLLCSVIDRMGASVDYIVVNDFQNDIYYAKLIINANWMQMEIDSRPSDAIAIALRVRAPIYVEKAVLDKVGIHPDREAGKYTTMHIGKDKIGLASQCFSQNQLV